MTADLDELDRLLAAATVRPWTINLDAVGGADLVGFDGAYVMDELAAFYKDDAALIVAAVNALPALIAELREKTAAIARVKSLHVPWYEVDGVRHDNLVSVGCEQYPGCEGTADNECQYDEQHEVPACYECRCVIDYLPGYLFWPCPTVRALSGTDTQEADRG